MTHFTDKAMELADKYASSARSDGSNDAHHSLTDVRREALRQHLERGELDCRTCSSEKNCYQNYMAGSRYKISCTNGSEYERAEFKMLWKEKP